MGSHALLQGIFSTQGLNLGLPHCRQTFYHLSHQGSPSDPMVTTETRIPRNWLILDVGKEIYGISLKHCVKSKEHTGQGHFKETSVQFSSVTQSCPTLCDPMNHSTPGLPVHHQLLEFTQTHVHRVHDAIQPSHPRSSPSSPAPNPSQHQSLFQ